MNLSLKEFFSRDTSWNVIIMMFVVLLGFSIVAAQGNPSTFGLIILSGLLRAMLLFLVAAGLSLIFGLMDILNFAQGAYFMVGAYLTYDIQHANSGFIDATSLLPDPNLRFIFGIIVSVIVGAGLGVFLERVMLRPLYDRPLFQLVLTFGVSIIMLEAIKFIWNTTPYTWQETIGIQGVRLSIFGAQFSAYRLFIIAMGLVLIVAVALLLRRTRIGIIIRAGVEDPEMVSALGVNVRAVFTLVFTLGCALAAFGGGVAAPFLGATISMGNTYLLASIAVIVLGGFGSYEGTAIASFIVGLAWVAMENFTIAQPALGSVWASMTPMLVLALILLLRPRGLFGGER